MSQKFIVTVIGLKDFAEKLIFISEKNDYSKENNLKECIQCNDNFYEKYKQNKLIIWKIRELKHNYFCSQNCIKNWLETNDFQGLRAKTVTVKWVSVKLHPKYSKLIKKTKKWQVHNEKFYLKPGDEVVIKNSRPYSATKRFIVARKERENENIKKSELIITGSMIKYKHMQKRI
ncbi:uS17 family ribosomal protein [endosymbiont GvMRE of Glomus versiforme]|uniref:uS17 family ribosomal protein n=1 Tax=endosymbiont GvMRE of Glomus versiforme TaxID=2039283 RepID=UPI000EC93693|nr:uS17 family ribosomal protein [endosymbiont GvMRE of Glomus versiforme]RHZ35451.1 30S ribosomal protein S17 [endosymbiont GvMRE of Glomus versiforme]